MFNNFKAMCMAAAILAFACTEASAAGLIGGTNTNTNTAVAKGGKGGKGGKGIGVGVGIGKGGNATATNVGINKNVGINSNRNTLNNTNDLSNRNRNVLRNTNDLSNRNTNLQGQKQGQMQGQGQQQGQAVIGSGNSRTKVSTSTATSTATHSANTNTSGVHGSGNSQQDQSNNNEININDNSVYEAQDRNPVNTAFSTPLTSSNDTCMGSTSAGAQGVSFGVSVGTTWTDEDCIRRKDARELFNMGMKSAALALMCENDKVAAAMKRAGTPCPGTDKKTTEVTTSAKLKVEENTRARTATSATGNHPVLGNVVYTYPTSRKN